MKEFPVVSSPGFTRESGVMPAGVSAVHNSAQIQIVRQLHSGQCDRRVWEIFLQLTQIQISVHVSPRCTL